MITKLTLTIEEETIKKAKRFAKESGKSLSALVESYLNLLTTFRETEDALQHFTAVENGDVEIIITRNLKDYKHSKVAVMTAGNFIQMNSSVG